MTNKSILIFLGMFLLVALPIVSAEKITYSEDDLKVTLSDTTFFGLIKTGDIGTADLKSHPSIDYVRKESVGTPTVLYYDFEFEEFTKDVLGEKPIFINMKNGERISKNWSYVIWEEFEREVPIYAIQKSLNGTIYQEQIGTEKVMDGEWVKYDSRDLPQGKVKIGVQVETKYGEWVDVIISLGNKEISKHASYTVVSVTSDSGITDDFGASQSAKMGAIWYVNVTDSSAYNISITNITKFSSSTSTTAYVQTAYASGVLGSATFSGDIATFSSPISINNSQLYYILLDAGGSSRTWRGDLGVSFPITNNEGTWVTGVNQLGANDTSNFIEIDQVSYQYYIPSGQLSIVLIDPTSNETITSSPFNLISQVTEGVGVAIENVSLLINGSIVETNVSNFSGIYNFSQSLPEGNYNYTVIAFGNDSIQYNASNGTISFTIDLFEPEISLFNPTNGSSSNRENWSLATNITPNNYTLINATTYVWFQNGTLFNSILNTSIAGTSEVLVNDTFTELPFGFTYYWNTEVFFQNNVPEIFSNFSSDNYSFTRLPFEVTNESYNFTSYETESQTFEINISTVSNILSTSISLNYDGERYFTETNCVDGTCELMQTIDIPLVDSGETENKTFFWELTLFTIENDVFQFNTTSHQQNVSRIHLEFEDSTYVNRTLNFTTWRESNRTILNPMSFKATFDSWLGSGSVKRNSTFENLSSFSGIQLAIDPAERTFYTDAIIEYDAVGNYSGLFTPRNYFFQNETLTTSVQNISLFLLETTDSTSFIQRVVDTSQIAQVGVLVLQQKYYPETNEYETVAISMTDSNGEGVGFYEIEVPEYRHIIISNGTILKITEKGKVVPQTTPYTLIFTLGEDVESPWTSFEGIENIISSLTFNQTTSIVTYEWIDSTGTITLVNLTVDQVYGNQSDVTICSETSLLTSGILTCNVSGYEGNFNAKGYITRTTTLIDKIVVFTISEIKDLLAIPSLGLFIILLIGVIGMSLAYPPAGVILIGVFLGLAQLIGITAISWIFVWAIILVGVWILIETT